MSALSRLPPLPKRAPLALLEWLIDQRAPQLGGCVPCNGRGRFVWHEWINVKLECALCKGTGCAL